MSRISILTFEKNPIAAELFSVLSKDHEVFVVYTKNTNLALKQLWQRPRGARWLWFNTLFKYAAALHNVGHYPKPSWDELSADHPDAFIQIGDHNTPECRSILRERNLDLGILIGTTVIRPDVFEIPRLGMINLHQGNIPAYRGTPPAFWEHHNREKEMYVTVHTVVERLDAGTILEEKKFPLSSHEHFVVSKFYANSLSVKILQAATAKRLDGSRGIDRQIKGKVNTVPSFGILAFETLKLLKKCTKNH